MLLCQEHQLREIFLHIQATTWQDMTRVMSWHVCHGVMVSCHVMASFEKPAKTRPTSEQMLLRYDIASASFCE